MDPNKQPCNFYLIIQFVRAHRPAWHNNVGLIDQWQTWKVFGEICLKMDWSLSIHSTKSQILLTNFTHLF